MLREFLTPTALILINVNQCYVTQSQHQVNVRYLKCYHSPSWILLKLIRNQCYQTRGITGEYTRYTTTVSLHSPTPCILAGVTSGKHTPLRHDHSHWKFDCVSAVREKPMQNKSPLQLFTLYLLLLLSTLSEILYISLKLCNFQGFCAT